MVEDKRVRKLRNTHCHANGTSHIHASDRLTNFKYPTNQIIKLGSVSNALSLPSDSVVSSSGPSSSPCGARVTRLWQRSKSKHIMICESGCPTAPVCSCRGVLSSLCACWRCDLFSSLVACGCCFSVEWRRGARGRGAGSICMLLRNTRNDVASELNSNKRPPKSTERSVTRTRSRAHCVLIQWDRRMIMRGLRDTHCFDAHQSEWQRS